MKPRAVQVNLIMIKRAEMLTETTVLSTQCDIERKEREKTRTPPLSIRRKRSAWKIRVDREGRRESGRRYCQLCQPAMAKGGR